jgi:hypothetical protein
VRQVGAKKANVSEPLMTYRKRKDDVKTEGSRYLGMSAGGDLLTARVASGMKMARAWFRHLCGTREPVARCQSQRWLTAKGDRQAAETVRRRVPMRTTGADRPVVVMKPSNAGGAKGAGCPGVFTGQPKGRSR